MFLTQSCIYYSGNRHVATDSAGAVITIDSSHAFAIPLDSLPVVDSIRREPEVKEFFSGKQIDTKKVPPEDVIEFAKTLIGIPYKYGSTDPKAGFDCSGFFTYVFRHFNIVVPRSSIDFTEVGQEIPLEKAKNGDIILFTGTDSTERFVGHMGMIVETASPVQFIHSTSGKQYGVTITPMSNYYKGRYLKTIRIFPENN
jgi:hypothetical protein